MIEVDCRDTVHTAISGLKAECPERPGPDWAVSIDLFRDIGGASLTEELENRKNDPECPTRPCWDVIFSHNSCSRCLPARYTEYCARRVPYQLFRLFQIAVMMRLRLCMCAEYRHGKPLYHSPPLM